MITRILAAIGRKIAGPDPRPARKDAPLSVPEVQRFLAAPLTDHEKAAITAAISLPRRPRRDIDAALYALAGSPIGPDDEVYVTESGAIIHHHIFTAEESR